MNEAVAFAAPPDAEQLSHEAWGSRVDIAEMLRHETINEIHGFLQGLHWEESLSRAGNDHNAMFEHHRRDGWSDAPWTLSLHLAYNLLRNLPLEDFIENTPQDLLRTYALDQDKEVDPSLLLQCPMRDHDFWHGMMREGREIFASNDGEMRLRDREISMRGMTKKKLRNSARVRMDVNAAAEQKFAVLHQIAIRQVLSNRIVYRNLLERDRMLDSVFHIIDDAADRLCMLIQQERKKR